MIDLSKFEKIDGREAVRRLANGEHIFSKVGVEYKTNAHGFLFYLDYVEKKWETSRIAFNNLVAQGFYIPKPFDVRQAMRDKPDEWVGKFRSGAGVWYKVGFDSDSMQAVEASFIFNGKPKCASGVTPLRANALDVCVDIKDTLVNVDK